MNARLCVVCLRQLVERPQVFPAYPGSKKHYPLATAWVCPWDCRR